MLKGLVHNLGHGQSHDLGQINNTGQPSTSLGQWTGSVGVQPPTSGSSLQNKRSVLANQPYEKFLKRSIPFVSLCLDQTNRNIVIDSIISNVYIKIADSSVSGQALLSAVAAKVGCGTTDLVILDAVMTKVRTLSLKNLVLAEYIFYRLRILEGTK